jgi:hypothetical protein
MRNTDAVVLPLSCPKCDRHEVSVQVASATVLTVKCAGCQHTWSIDGSTLPPDVRQQVNEATAIRG